MAELRMMVGIPGSGKSTLAEGWLSRREVDVIISSDAIRKEITGDAGDVSRDTQMWPIFYRRIAEALGKEQRVVADATHLTPATRAELFACRMDAVWLCDVSAHIVTVAYEVACKRNADRTRVVPDFVMERMFTSFTENCDPDMIEAEGFEVYVYESE